MTESSYNVDHIVVGRSARMRAVFDFVRVIADSDSSVLVTGETGTGKELIANLVHHPSARGHKPFVPVSCAILSETLIESELFGHERGAFTGAIKDRPGRFELAHGGTIFLDDIDDVPLSMQVKLLRVLQNRTIERLGGTRAVPVDVRVITGSKRDLRQMVAEGKFREDLFYRLNVITLLLPPLRERKEDIPLLADHLIERLAAEGHRRIDGISREAVAALMAHDWPGNVRELENVIERAVVLCSSPRIGIDLVPDHVRATRPFHMPTIVVPPEGISFKEVVGDFERRLIESTLEAAGGVQKRAAELLHIKPTTLNEMIKRYDIRPRRTRRLEEPISSGDRDAPASPAAVPPVRPGQGGRPA